MYPNCSRSEHRVQDVVVGIEMVIAGMLGTQFSRQGTAYCCVKRAIVARSGVSGRGFSELFSEIAAV